MQREHEKPSWAPHAERSPNSAVASSCDLAIPESGSVRVPEHASAHQAPQTSAFQKKIAPEEAAGTTGAGIWPDLETLSISQTLRNQRAAGIGGSDANIIMSGDEERVLRLWREKRGELEPEDLTGVLPVMLGSWTEAFNLQWYERLTGHLVSHAGKSVCAETEAWRRCTLDGYVSSLNAVWEAKHTSAFTKSEEVVERYMPQLQHNMAVMKSPRAVLSVIFGNARWEVFDVAADWLYQEELLIAEARFWDCVRSGERPVAVTPPPAPKAVGVREVSLEGNNLWASAAADWLEYRPAARLHAAAATLLRELVEDDVSRAYGHGIEARRNKAGAISIKEIGA